MGKTGHVVMLLACLAVAIGACSSDTSSSGEDAGLGSTAVEPEITVAAPESATVEPEMTVAPAETTIAQPTITVVPAAQPPRLKSGSSLGVAQVTWLTADILESPCGFGSQIPVVESSAFAPRQKPLGLVGQSGATVCWLDLDTAEVLTSTITGGDWDLVASIEPNAGFVTASRLESSATDDNRWDVTFQYHDGRVENYVYEGQLPELTNSDVGFWDGGFVSINRSSVSTLNLATNQGVDFDTADWPLVVDGSELSYLEPDGSVRWTRSVPDAAGDGFNSDMQVAETYPLLTYAAVLVSSEAGVLDDRRFIDYGSGAELDGRSLVYPSKSRCANGLSFEGLCLSLANGFIGGAEQARSNTELLEDTSERLIDASWSLDITRLGTCSKPSVVGRSAALVRCDAGALFLQATDQPAVQPGDSITAEQTPGSRGKITMARADWTTGYVQAEIYKLLLEELGYEVSEPSELELSSSIAYIAMSQGEIDFWANSWYPIHLRWLEADRPDGSRVGDHLTRVGNEMVAGGLQGFLITKSVAEAYGITTLDQLFGDPELSALFDQDGDGQAEMYGCPESWTCDNIITEMACQFDWPVTQIQAGYDTMIAEATDLANAGEPMVIYTWTPSIYITKLIPGDNVMWISVEDDVTDVNCSDQRNGEDYAQPNAVAAINGDSCLSNSDGECNLGWSTADIQVTANSEFLEANPVAAELFDQVVLPLIDISLANAEQDASDGSVEAIASIAERWVEANRGLVDGWLEAARAVE